MNELTFQLPDFDVLKTNRKLVSCCISHLKDRIITIWTTTTCKIFCLYRDFQAKYDLSVKMNKLFVRLRDRWNDHDLRSSVLLVFDIFLMIWYWDDWEGRIFFELKRNWKDCWKPLVFDNGILCQSLLVLKIAQHQIPSLNIINFMSNSECFIFIHCLQLKMFSMCLHICQ